LALLYRWIRRSGYLGQIHIEGSSVDDKNPTVNLGKHLVLKPLEPHRRVHLAVVVARLLLYLEDETFTWYDACLA